MLLLGSRTMTIEGITIFPDHADPSQFWYLPGPVQLARRDGRAAFTFIKYKPAAVAGGAKGGGFLIFEINLRLDPDLERRILSKLRSISKGQPKLAVVPFDEGTVQCMALDLQGSGGTIAQPAGPGSFRAIEKILGAAVPSLQSDNSASFSLTLSQEGAAILEKALNQGTQPIGVIYDLKFSGMRPALNVEITADFEKIYNQFSGGGGAQIYYVRADIDAAFEKLVQDGAIKIKVLNFTGEADETERETSALDFFKDSLLKEWFEPTLTPGQIAGDKIKPESLDNVLKLGNSLRPAETPAPPRPETSPVTSDSPKETSPTKETGSGEKKEGYNPLPNNPATAKDARPTEGTGSPTTSDNPPAPSSVGVKVPPSQIASLPAGLSSSSGGWRSISPVSFKLRIIQQEEHKHVKLVYDHSEATQRTYAPQGFFGQLVSDLEKDEHFVEVDLDDPFFRVFTVHAETPIDFEQIGLNSIHLALNYGDPTEPETFKHKEIVFDKDQKEPQVFEVFMNKQLDNSYMDTPFSITLNLFLTGWEIDSAMIFHLRGKRIARCI